MAHVYIYIHITHTYTHRHHLCTALSLTTIKFPIFVGFSITLTCWLDGCHSNMNLRVTGQRVVDDAKGILGKEDD